MNKQTEALNNAQEVPLMERLRKVPKDARLIIDDADGMSSSVYPVGFLCHQAAEALEQPAQDDDLMTGTWIRYNDGDDNKRLALELDIAMNGVDGAAKSPALIDVLAQAVDYFKNAKTYHILPIDDIKEHEESAYCDCYPRIEPHGLNNVVIHNSFDGREALEQPIAHINIGDKGKVTFEEQPARLVSYAPDKSTCTLNIDGEEVYFNREQPAQEPVAWIKEVELGYMKSNIAISKMDYRTNLGLKPELGDVPLYTHPAPSWQGLSDDEIEEIIVGKNGTYFNFARAIEQALKERNS